MYYVNSIAIFYLTHVSRRWSVDGARRVPLNHVHANAKAAGRRTIIATSNIISEYTIYEYERYHARFMKRRLYININIPLETRTAIRHLDERGNRYLIL